MIGELLTLILEIALATIAIIFGLVLLAVIIGGAIAIVRTIKEEKGKK